MAFSFGLNNLLAPETPVIAPVPPVKPVGLNVAVEDIMRNAQAMVNGKKSQSSLTEAIKSVKSELVTDTPIPPTMPEKVQVVAPETVPTMENSATIIPEIKTVETKVEPEEIEKSPSKNMTDLELNSGREYVEVFLKELSAYLKSGQELEALLTTKDNARKDLDSKKEETVTLAKSGEEIKDAIQVFLNAQSEETQRQDLANVLAAYESFKVNFDKKVEELEKTGSQEINKILVNINAKKGEIAKLVAAMGSQENVKKIIDYVRRSENVAKRFNEKKMANIPERSAIMNFIQDEAVSGKMFIEGNDLTGLLMAIFSKPQKTN